MDSREANHPKATSMNANVAQSATDTLLIDTDVHESIRSPSDLLPYLSSAWRKHITDYGWGGTRFPGDFPYAVPVPGRGGVRKDWILEDGTSGTSLEMMQRHLFDEEGVTHAILNGVMYPSVIRANHEFAAALGSAYNDWQLANWLEKDSRLRGSIHVSADDPQAAVREIRRSAANQAFVQVFLPTSTDIQWGDPRYHVIYEAATEHDLAIGFHHSNATKLAFGWPRHYIEWHTLAAPQAAMNQIVSLIFNGVFDKFPQLKAVFLEPGIGWLPWLVRRADQQYREVRINVPWVKRLPSEYIRENIRLSTQPISDVPPQVLLHEVDEIKSQDVYMFSTDYPHYDADTAGQGASNALPKELRNKIRYGNALATYPRLQGLGS